MKAGTKRPRIVLAPLHSVKVKCGVHWALMPRLFSLQALQRSSRPSVEEYASSPDQNIYNWLHRFTATVNETHYL
jgi:hypothetical protein